MASGFGRSSAALMASNQREADVETEVVLTDAMKGRGDTNGIKAPTVASNPNWTHSLTLRLPVFIG